MSMENKDLIRKYEAERPLYKKLVKEVIYVLNEELLDSKVKIASIDGRAKSVKSFTEKIQRKQYSASVSNFTDLAGIRIVCYYEKDLEVIREIVDRNFKIEETVDKTEELGIDKMGYTGLHLVGCMGKSYSGPRYDSIVELVCEIQIRTVLQDAWAIISHHLVYKNEESIPPRIRRDLNNVASLMEIAQGVFDSGNEIREQYLNEIEESSKQETSFLSQPVDYDTLYAYTQWKYPDKGVDSYWHAELLKDLDLKKYKNLREVDNIINRASEVVNRYAVENPLYFSSGTDYITKSFGKEDLEFRSKHSWSKDTIDFFVGCESG